MKIPEVYERSVLCFVLSLDFPWEKNDARCARISKGGKVFSAVTNHDFHSAIQEFRSHHIHHKY